MSKDTQRLHSNNWPAPRKNPPTLPEVDLSNISLGHIHSHRKSTQQQPTSVAQPRKGDIAPPNYDLMSTQNTGRINLNFFQASPFSFARAALATLLQPHFDIKAVPKDLIFDRQNPTSLVSTPDSIRYRKLAHRMKGKRSCLTITISTSAAGELQQDCHSKTLCRHQRTLTTTS